MRVAVSEVVTDDFTTLVSTENVVVDRPAGTITVAGTPTTEGSLLEMETITPPDPAGPANVIDPTLGFPPVTLPGLTVSDARVSGLMVRVEVLEI